MSEVPVRRGPRLGALLAAALFGSALFGALPREAHADISTPGAHRRYRVEIEPHLALQYDRRWRGAGTGIGPGLRVTLPILQDGPVKTIDNNLGLALGLDYTHFSGCDRPGTTAECSVESLWMPVMAQWNFFFSEQFSAFGELGFSLLYRSVDWDKNCPFLDSEQCHAKSFRPLEPVLFVGGRYLITPGFGVVGRIGSPYASLGVDFLL